MKLDKERKGYQKPYFKKCKTIKTGTQGATGQAQRDSKRLSTCGVPPGVNEQKT